MKHIPTRLSALGACACLTLAAGCAGDGEAPTDLAFATLDQGSDWYRYGVSMGEQLESALPAGSIVEILPYSGAIGNPELVADSRDADLALSFNVVSSWAYEGAEGTPFEGEPQEDLRALVGGVDQYYFGPIAPMNASFASLSDIAEQDMGVRLVSQPRGSIGEAGTSIVLSAYGLSVEEIEGNGGNFEPTSTDVATDAIRDGAADLWIQSISEGHPNITELAQTSDIQLLDIEDEEMDFLIEYGFTDESLPAGTFQGQDEDVRLPGMRTSIVTSAELDEDTAYAITEAIVEGADTLKENNGSMDSFNPDEAWTEENIGGLPLHPGAERYYQEAGLMD